MYGAAIAHFLVMQNHGNSAITLLKHDHQTVKKLFSEISSGKGEAKKKQAIFAEIKHALDVHAAIEEEIFYPAVKKARSEHVRDEVREGYEEHKQVKGLLTEIADTNASEESYDAKLKLLQEDVDHHVHEEETKMFPDATKYLGESRLLSLGSQLEQRKQQLEKNHPSSKK